MLQSYLGMNYSTMFVIMKLVNMMFFVWRTSFLHFHTEWLFVDTPLKKMNIVTRHIGNNSSVATDYSIINDEWLSEYEKAF